jgi:hypothetical protein
MDESKAFEHFINYCIVSGEHPENFDLETVSVGAREIQASKRFTGPD